MNIQNLKKNTERTPKERIELARKAGKASGEARNYAKNLRNAIENELQSDDGKINGYEKIGRAIIAKAQRGDVQAAAFVAKILGEDITRVESMTTTADERITIVIPWEWTKEQRKKWTPIITQALKVKYLTIFDWEVRLDK